MMNPLLVTHDDTALTLHTTAAQPQHNRQSNKIANACEDDINKDIDNEM
jgi:hypothetical protein